ncbi:hypothetical protein [Arthrobacter sp. UM1]|uniref:hypothetical protein n=1 Tax=Arthrobacter sp. UM1 TaxID=2766776 RepID=UPI001CF643C8|nr:hypothetical protein [Arthrobacter sp. UM1]MCB4207672.1 hypothetical protein [Arthrobacter sp. UM1]
MDYENLIHATHAAQPSQVFSDEIAERIVCSIPRLIGERPESSLVIALVRGRYVGPCIRADIPYGEEDLGEWSHGLSRRLLEAEHSDEAVVLCFESDPQRGPEWFRELFLAVGGALKRAGARPHEFLWVSSEPGWDEPPSEDGASGSRAADTEVPRLEAEQESRLRSLLGDALEAADARVEALAPLGEHSCGEPCLASLGPSMSRALIRPESVMGPSQAVVTVEAVDLLIGRLGGESSVWDVLERLPALGSSLARAAAVPAGVELILRTAVAGRSEGLAAVDRRYSLAEADDLFMRADALSLAEELLDPPGRPEDPLAWAERAASSGSRRRPQGQEGVLLRAARQAGVSLDEEPEARAAAAAAGFLDALHCEMPRTRLEDIRRLRTAAIALSQLAPPGLARRLGGIAAWTLWAEEQEAEALERLASTRSPALLTEDPVVEFVGELCAWDVSDPSGMAAPESDPQWRGSGRGMA